VSIVLVTGTEVLPADGIESSIVEFFEENEPRIRFVAEYSHDIQFRLRDYQVSFTFRKSDETLKYFIFPYYSEFRKEITTVEEFLESEAPQGAKNIIIHHLDIFKKKGPEIGWTVFESIGISYANTKAIAKLKLE